MINKILFFLFLLFLPTQLGKHFFLDFSYLSGVRVDYLAPTIYLTDTIIFLCAIANSKIVFNRPSDSPYHLDISVPIGM